MTIDTAGAAQQRGPGLTGQELLVLQLMAHGYSRHELGDLLAIHEDEVALVERSACEALGARTVRQALEIARRRSLIL
jgi:DNA-binding CsgD family transcriptional regulator